jgi:hypothetical protein
MRALVIMALLSLGIASSASAAQPPGTVPFCVSGHGCVPTTNASYIACYELGLHRGFNTSKGDERNLSLFVLQCLAGKIPR